jgi:hypothetical protein
VFVSNKQASVTNTVVDRSVETRKNFETGIIILELKSTLSWDYTA